MILESGRNVEFFVSSLCRLPVAEIYKFAVDSDARGILLCVGMPRHALKAAAVPSILHAVVLVLLPSGDPQVSTPIV